MDDDGDGLVDCADPTCAAADCPEACADGFDNNLDGRIDCDDFGCDGHCAEVCDDDRDNDGDGDKDCFDAECSEVCDVDRDGSFNASVGGDDCDDAQSSVFPGAPEVCDGLDNDCDGQTDDADPTLDPQTRSRWFADNDLDGYGGPLSSIACAPTGDEVDNDDDCVDIDADRNPAATEVCNGVDDDCDDVTDDLDPTLDLATTSNWFLDNDRDDLGDPAVMVSACARPPGHVDNADDCDDSDPQRLGPSLWVPDVDGDGFGRGVPVGPLGCNPPPGAFGPDNVQDCDDGEVDIYPGAFEVCGDGVDSDCDFEDCLDWSEDFELGPPLGPDWVSAGAASWLVSGGNAHAGSFSGASGNIGDNDDSNLGVVLDFAAGGTIAFWHAGSTEDYYDFLQFRIDGVLQDEWSGVWSWSYASYALSPGVHELRWTYTKDFSVSDGADTVWIDDVLATGGYP